MHLLQHFYKQIVENPSKIAVCNANTAYSFTDIDNMSNKIKSAIEQFNILENIVPVYLENDIYVLPVFLGIIKAGKAVMALSTSLPIDESLQRIADVSHSIVFTDQSVITKSINIVDIFRSGTENVEAVRDKMENNLFVVMTSGSTGIPKKICLTNANLENFFSSFAPLYNCDCNSVTLFSTAYTFDVSLIEILSPIYFGCKLICFDQTTPDYKIINLVLVANKYNVTHLTVVPTFAEMFLSTTNGSLNSVKVVGFAGEKLTSKVVNDLRTRNSSMRILNLYGPAETTIYATYYEIKQNCNGDIPIGSPFPHVTIELQNLDSDGIGEIIIGGPCVTDGYIDKNSNSFFYKNGINYYRTGDLGFIEDNLLYFVGRRDNQHKINGIRIELDEISNAAMQIENVSNVKVCVQNNVVYVFLQIYDRNLDIDYISILRHKLPNTIAIRIAIVDTFIMSPNGKLDFKKMIKTHFSLNLQADDIVTEYLINTYNTTNYIGLNSIERVRMALHFCNAYHLLFEEKLLYSKKALLDAIENKGKQNVNISKNVQQITKAMFIDAISEIDTGVFLKKHPQKSAALLYCHFGYLNKKDRYGYLKAEFFCAHNSLHQIIDMVQFLFEHFDVFNMVVSNDANSLQFRYYEPKIPEILLFLPRGDADLQAKDILENGINRPLYVINFDNRSNVLTFYFSHAIMDQKSSNRLLSIGNQLLCDEMSHNSVMVSEYLDVVKKISHESSKKGIAYYQLINTLQQPKRIPLTNSFNIFKLSCKSTNSNEIACLMMYIICEYCKSIDKYKDKHIGFSTILEIDKYNAIIGDTHTTIPIVVDLQEENIYVQICDQSQKMIMQAEEGFNCRDALYKSGEGHLWKNLTFTINYLGETPNIIKEIEHHYIDRHPAKYLIGYTYKGDLYIISFSDFLHQDRFSIQFNDTNIDIERIQPHHPMIDV